MSVLPAPGQEPVLMPGASDGLSEGTRQLVESEARRIVDDCYARAVESLCENRDRLDRLAAALLEHESLDEADAYRVAGVDRESELAERKSGGAIVAPADRARTGAALVRQFGR
jgi:cell division protease FtsH